MSAHVDSSHDHPIPDPYQTTPSPSPQRRSLPDGSSSEGEHEDDVQLATSRGRSRRDVSKSKLLFRAPDLDAPYEDVDDAPPRAQPPRRGWLAHQSVFPSSSRSEASASASTSPPASVVGGREDSEGEDDESSFDPELGESYSSRSRRRSRNDKPGGRSFFGFSITGPGRWSRAAPARGRRRRAAGEDGDDLLSDLDDALGPSRHHESSIAGPSSFARRVSPSSLGSLETLDYGADADNGDPARAPHTDAVLKADAGESLESLDERALDDPLVDGDAPGIPQRLEIYSNRLGHWKGELPLQKYKGGTFCNQLL